jgi:hypothetical protein
MKKLNNKLFIWLGVAVVTLIIIAVVGKKKGWFGGKDETMVSMAVAEIKTVIETVSANGKIQPETEVKISSDVSGEIRELYVKEGDSGLFCGPRLGGFGVKCIVRWLGNDNNHLVLGGIQFIGFPHVINNAIHFLANDLLDKVEYVTAFHYRVSTVLAVRNDAQQISCRVTDCHLEQVGRRCVRVRFHIVPTIIENLKNCGTGPGNKVD